ncbi:MAG TPA: hypothetical protein VLA34_03795 [Candidatus Krumholzibacterium sp.]|nr:hypothetical protein [Candidatus Krumholzibacterium sp.]
MNKAKSVFAGSAHRRRLLPVVLAAALAGAGCGGSGGGGDGGDTLAAAAGRRVGFEGFSLVLPEDMSGGEEVLLAGGTEGDSGLLFTFGSGGKLLVYRTAAAVGLTLQEMADITSLANGAVWREEDAVVPSVESYKMIRLGEARAMLLVGSWDGEGGGGDLRVYGTHCGGHFYLIESLHKGGWDAKLSEAALSFRCEG